MHVQNVKELRYIELFAGQGNVFSCVRKVVPAAAIDITYLDNPPPNNPYDINSEAGFG